MMMNLNKTALLFLIGLLLHTFTIPLVGAGTGSGLNTLVLKNKAFVSDDIIRVKDIALMDAPTRTRIGSLVIAVSPELGKTTTIHKQEIHEKLVGNGFQVTSAQIKGSPSVIVMRKGMAVKPSFFKNQIHRYIVTHSRWKDGVQVEITTSKKIVIPESGVRWQLMPANGQDFFGNVLFKVKAFSNTSNEEIYSNWLVVKLKIVKRLAISNRTIGKNERIGAGDIRWETREITAFIKDALFNESEIIGQKAGRIIRPNSVITTSLLEEKYLVRRGGTAKLVAKLRGINAVTTVKVLSNGSLGDTVRVMNTGSKKIISAVVTGKNRLEVTVE